MFNKNIKFKRWPFFIVAIIALLVPAIGLASNSAVPVVDFPMSVAAYQDAGMVGIGNIIKHRIAVNPFNAVVTIIFILAIIHTFFTSKFVAVAHKLDQKHQVKQQEQEWRRKSLHFGAGLLHFLGDIEAVFGLWVIVLGGVITIFYDWNTVVYYIGHKVSYIEALFVVVIMTIAASRPLIKFFELLMWKIVKFFGGSLEAWWLTILTLGPITGSFITGPAAMTITALLLAQKFYSLNPSTKLKYATLALLFVNVSTGSSLTNFASPPILMVSGAWNWDLWHIFANFGWKAIISVCIANVVYFIYFRKDFEALRDRYRKQQFKRHVQRRFIDKDELESKLDMLEFEVNKDVGFTNTFSEVSNTLKDEIKEMAYVTISQKEFVKYDVENSLEARFEDIKKEEMQKAVPGLLSEEERPPYRDPHWDEREDFVPKWIMFVHVLFVLWTVVNIHEPVLFIGGFLFYLGFTKITAVYQNRVNLKPALMVGFFLAGLVIHGGLQSWWIGPVLGNLNEIPLMLGAMGLTAFNDNAAITFLCTLIPNLSEKLRYAVVAGAITGGGLTIIANSPNPAGQSILKKYFKHGISPLSLLIAALIPTIIAGFCFIFL